MYAYSKNDMYTDRRPPQDVTPAYEDAGLFKTAICQQMLELMPMIRRNDRGDLIVRAFVDRKIEIDVFFAGRRVADAGPLEKRLKTMMTHARKKASDISGPPPDVTKIRLPLRVEGAWRRSLHRDDSGWETGSYHFVAARWSMLDAEGNTVTFGEAPLI